MDLGLLAVDDLDRGLRVRWRTSLTAGTSSVEVAVLTVPTRTARVLVVWSPAAVRNRVDGLEHLDHVLLQLAAAAADPGARAAPVEQA